MHRFLTVGEKQRFDRVLPDLDEFGRSAMKFIRFLGPPAGVARNAGQVLGFAEGWRGGVRGKSTVLRRKNPSRRHNQARPHTHVSIFFGSNHHCPHNCNTRRKPQVKWEQGGWVASVDASPTFVWHLSAAWRQSAPQNLLFPF